ncbi:thiamine pyrophosphate-dependent enzyme [Kocuria rosea]|jgi:2-oxoisovalerate dehydrogenase E1 component alpha subunit|uniref:thiamine pyrophosphate-dependent enzyme n=1 Tax=Kocuria rosea TaxID=1275 RepID=UPI002040E0D8|nr:thiamine pyrophosphate-dependent enzyme [Kocuria rosea]MCM3686461.1 thiamine pyrophosphate-dependent enzyme [Kocuria rosea]HST72295.1 thiamine pyrophosphate-dependent enzyme [Kocuria rosea]
MDAAPSSPAAHAPGRAAAAPQVRTRLVRLLDRDGRLGEDPVFSPHVGDIGTEELRGLYRSMALARRFDEEAHNLQRQGELVLWAPMRGQEAAQVGSVRAVLPDDHVFPTYREHAVAIERGVDPAELLTVFRGHAAGGWKPSEHHMGVYSIVLGCQVPHAVGYAMGMDLDRRAAEAEGREAAPGAALVYFGDGTSTQGEVHEGMVFAASYDAPVVFFVQNNQWAISVPFSTQSRVPLAERAAGYGFEGIRVDGNDVLGVLAVTRYALEKARRGEGPVLVEAETYRLGAHTTADDPTKYRDREDERRWAELDPLVRLETHLRECHGTGDDFFAAVAADAQVFADAARAHVLAMSPPRFEEFFDKPYAEPHPLVEEERAWYAAYQAGFADDDAEGGDGAGPAGPDRGTQASGLTVAADPDHPAEGTASGTQEDLA